MKKNKFVVSILLLLFFLNIKFVFAQKNKTSSGIKQDIVTDKLAEKQVEKKQKPKITFIELGSVRCIPCRMMQPIMEEIAKEYKGVVEVVFYDVWTKEGSPYGQKYKIRAIPTQIFLDEEGNEFFRHEGFFPKESLKKILDDKLTKYKDKINEKSNSKNKK